MYVFYTHKDQRGKYCKPYKYLITTNGMTSYRAFVSIEAFKQYLRDRGLHLKKAGKQFAKIIGNYETKYTSPENFKKVKGGIETMVLNNGRYVPCKILDGIEYVYHTGVYDPNYDNNQYFELDKIYG